MVQRFAALFRGGYRQLQVPLQPLLADVIGKIVRPQRLLQLFVWLAVAAGTGVYNPLNAHVLPFYATWAVSQAGGRLAWAVRGPTWLSFLLQGLFDTLFGGQRFIDGCQCFGGILRRIAQRYQR